MKHHDFIIRDKKDPNPWDICSNCGLSWSVIKYQMRLEHSATEQPAPAQYVRTTEDDCNVRKRKQHLLAFI